MKKYIFTHDNYDRFSYDYFGYINTKEMKISSVSFLKNDFPDSVNEIDIANQMGSSDKIQYSLHTIEDNLDVDLFLVEYESGGDEYDDEESYFKITFDKDCKTETIKTVVDIVLSSNELKNIPISFVKSNDTFYSSKEDTKQMLLDEGITETYFQTIL